MCSFVFLSTHCRLLVLVVVGVCSLCDWLFVCLCVCLIACLFVLSFVCLCVCVSFSLRKGDFFIKSPKHPKRYTGHPKENRLFLKFAFRGILVPEC